MFKARYFTGFHFKARFFNGDDVVPGAAAANRRRPRQLVLSMKLGM